MSSNEFEPLWDVRQAARYLNISEKTIRNKCSNGDFPYVKVGGSLRFRPEEVRALVVSFAPTAEAVA